MTPTDDTAPVTRGDLRAVLEAMKAHGLARMPYRGDVPCVEDVALVNAGLAALEKQPPAPVAAPASDGLAVAIGTLRQAVRNNQSAWRSIEARERTALIERLADRAWPVHEAAEQLIAAYDARQPTQTPASVCPSCGYARGYWTRCEPQPWRRRLPSRATCEN